MTSTNPRGADEPIDEQQGDGFAQTVAFALFRSKLLVVAVVLLSALLGAAYAIVTPNTYESVGKLLVRPGARELVTPDAAVTDSATPTTGYREAVSNELQIFRSPELVQRMVETVGARRILSPFDPTAGDDDFTPPHIRALHRLQAWWAAAQSAELPAEGAPHLDQLAALVLQNGLLFEADLSSSTIIIRYTAQDPQLARCVVEAAIEACRHRHAEIFNLEQPHQLLEKRYAAAQATWHAAKEALAAFRIDHDLFEPEMARTALVEQLAEINAAVAQDEVELDDLRARLSFLTQTISEVRPSLARDVPDAETPNPMHSWLFQQIFMLKAQGVTMEVERSGTQAERESLRDRMSSLIQEGEEMLGTIEPYLAGAGATEVRENPRFVRLQDRIDEVREQVEGLTVAVRARRDQLDDIRSRLEEIERLVTEYHELSRRAENSLARLDQLSAQRDRLDALKGLDDLDVSNLRIVQQATLPAAKSGPRRSRLVVLATIGGLAAACVLALGFAQMSGRLRRGRDIGRVAGTELLRVVPESSALRRLRPGQIVSTQARLPTALTGLWVEVATWRRAGQVLRIGVVGASRDCGASAVAASIAIGLARGLGEGVLLADAHFEQPTLAERFGVACPLGLADAAVGQTRLTTVAVPAGIAGLSLVGAGSDVARNACTIAQVRGAIAGIEASDAAFVVVDIPPFAASPDAAHLVSALDVVIPVFRANKTDASEASEVVRTIVAAERPAPAILNRYRSPFPRWWPDAERG